MNKTINCYIYCEGGDCPFRGNCQRYTTDPGAVWVCLEPHYNPEKQYCGLYHRGKPREVPPRSGQPGAEPTKDDGTRLKLFPTFTITDEEQQQYDIIKHLVRAYKFLPKGYRSPRPPKVASKPPEPQPEPADSYTYCLGYDCPYTRTCARYLAEAPSTAVWGYETAYDKKQRKCDLYDDKRRKPGTKYVTPINRRKEQYAAKIKGEKPALDTPSDTPLIRQ